MACQPSEIHMLKDVIERMNIVQLNYMQQKTWPLRFLRFYSPVLLNPKYDASLCLKRLEDVFLLLCRQDEHDDDTHEIELSISSASSGQNSSTQVRYAV